MTAAAQTSTASARVAHCHRGGREADLVDGMDVVVAGGQENISSCRPAISSGSAPRTRTFEHVKHAYMPMLHTAEFVARKYAISREAQDEYALDWQQRTARAQAEAGSTRRSSRSRDDGDRRQGDEGISYKDVTLAKDEGNRPETTLASLQALAPVIEGGTVTAGNASQLSDGASACVLMEAKLAEQRGLSPLGLYRGMAVVGIAPEEMGIGPIYAVPRLLAQHGLTIGDIGLWELNEAFACQALYCRDWLGIDPDAFNVNGGAIAVGHPYGMTGRGWSAML